MKVLHFGAGKIGRGLIYPKLSDTCEVTLVDSRRDLIEMIRARGRYHLFEVEKDERSTIEISNPSVASVDEAMANVDYDLITTSVIERNLEDIAPVLEKIIRRNKRPLYIAPMENTLTAKDRLAKFLSIQNAVEEGVYLLGSVIDRIVPKAVGDVDLECERFWSIIIQDDFGFADVNEGAIELSPTIDREFEKKLLLVNGLHACAAYLGYSKRLNYIFEVFQHAELRSVMREVGRCYLAYMVNGMGFDDREIERKISESLIRFANPLEDPLSRVGRNMMLKLSRTERICRPLLFNMAHGLEFEPLQKVVHAAREFRIGNDYERYLKDGDISFLSGDVAG